MPPDQSPFDDRVLRAATVVTRIVIVLLWALIVVIAVALPLLLLNQAEVVDELGKTIPLDSARVIPGLSVVLLGAVALLLLGTRFFARLLALMRTVDQGDPFVPENADRLRAMAWLLLAIEILGFAIGLLSQWAVGRSNGFEFSITGLIAVLSLFVLARVFARGTAMREDIEGTV